MKTPYAEGGLKFGGFESFSENIYSIISEFSQNFIFDTGFGQASRSFFIDKENETFRMQYGLFNAFEWHAMEYPTSHLYFLYRNTSLYFRLVFIQLNLH